MRKLVVVIDMQNDFVTGSLGTKEAKEIVNRVVNSIEREMAAGSEVVFTMDSHDVNYLESSEGKNLPVKHCIKGTNGWEIIPELRKYMEEETRIFEKPSFGSLDLAAYAKENKFEEIELMGLCTDICVVSNGLLLKANLPEALIQVDSKACAGVTPKSHESALETMRMCQIIVK